MAANAKGFWKYSSRGTVQADLDGTVGFGSMTGQDGGRSSIVVSQHNRATLDWTTRLSGFDWVW